MFEMLVWDVSSGKELAALKVNLGDLPGGVHDDITWSPDGSKFAISRGKKVRVLDVASGSESYTFEAHECPLYAVEWSPDGSKLASGSSDRTVKVWDAATGNELHKFKDHEAQGSKPGLNLCESGSVGWSPDGTMLASGSSDKTVRIWDVASGRELHALKGHKTKVYIVAWSPDGARLATGDGAGLLKVWDPFSGIELHTLEGHRRMIGYIDWSPDGAKLASSSYSDGKLIVWDVASGRKRHTLDPGGPGLINGVYTWNPDGIRLVSDGEDTLNGGSTVKVWDVDSGSERECHKIEDGDEVWSCGWSSDGTLLVTYSDFWADDTDAFAFKVWSIPK